MYIASILFLRVPEEISKSVMYHLFFHHLHYFHFIHLFYPCTSRGGSVKLVYIGAHNAWTAIKYKQNIMNLLMNENT